MRLPEEKGISPLELELVLQQLGTDGVLDRESKAYRDRGLAWMEFDAREEILSTPMLMKLPEVRNGAKTSAGLSENVWEQWQREES